MAIDQVDRTVVTQGPTAAAGQETVRTDSRRITRTGPGGVSAQYSVTWTYQVS